MQKAAHRRMEHMNDIVTDDVLHGCEECIKTESLLSFVG